jgi:hypothetical protein
MSLLFECTTDGTKARSRARGRRNSRCIGESSSFNGAIAPVIIALAAARAAPQAKKVQEHADISEIEGEISLDSTARTSR